MLGHSNFADKKWLASDPYIIVNPRFLEMDERKTCPVKRSIPSPTKIPIQHFLPNASMEDIKNDDLVLEMAKKYGRISVKTTIYCEYLKDTKETLCRTGKMVTPWWFP